MPSGQEDVGHCMDIFPVHEDWDWDDLYEFCGEYNSVRGQRGSAVPLQCEEHKSALPLYYNDNSGFKTFKCTGGVARDPRRVCVTL